MNDRKSESPVYDSMTNKSVEPKAELDSPSGEVGVEMRLTDELLERLVQKIDILHQMIEPILRQSQPDAKDYDKPRPSSGMGNWVASQNMSLEMSLDHLTHMIDRVDL